MFGCFVIASFWYGRGIWAVPNLFSTVFYGDLAYQDEFLRTTWAGLALIVVMYGILGGIWGCFWKERKPLLSFFGVVTGLATYYFLFNFFWTRVDSLIPLYVPIRQLQVAHILWGAALARSPVYAARISRAVSESAKFGAANQQGAQIVSGELIR
jgi:hypothetical protein